MKQEVEERTFDFELALMNLDRRLLKMVKYCDKQVCTRYGISKRRGFIYVFRVLMRGLFQGHVVCVLFEEMLLSQIYSNLHFQHCFSPIKR